MLFWRNQANLWTLLTPPAVWSLHFLFCYVAAAIDCAKYGLQSDLSATRLAIGGATALALVVIAACGFFGYRRWGAGSELPPYDEPTSAHREQFLGVCTLLLASLSFVGVTFVALPPIFITDCR